MRNKDTGAIRKSQRFRDCLSTRGLSPQADAQQRRPIPEWWEGDREKRLRQTRDTLIFKKQEKRRDPRKRPGEAETTVHSQATACCHSRPLGTGVAVDHILADGQKDEQDRAPAPVEFRSNKRREVSRWYRGLFQIWPGKTSEQSCRALSLSTG